MSWIAMTDLSRPVFNIRGIESSIETAQARAHMQPDELLPRGTLLFEFTYAAQTGEPQPLVEYRRRRDWLRALHINIDEKGALHLFVRQGGARTSARLQLPMPERDTNLRVSYTWDAPARTGRLAAEFLDLGKMFLADVPDPMPLPAEDARVIIRNGRRTELSAALRYLAFSDAVEPVGFGAGMLAGTRVETADGPVPVERIRLGDMVLTAESGPRPVRWIGKRTVPAFGNFQPIRLRKPYFGLTEDVTLSPAHLVRFDFSEAEYLIGKDEFLLPAAALVDDKHALYQTGRRVVSYYQILLDVHDCVRCAGIWAETMFVGVISRRPDVVRATVLGDLPASALPVHRAMPHHRLASCEARSLAAALGRA